MLTTLDLFAGIGGFARGLEATGSFETTCFVENEPYCQAVLRHHWPDVTLLGDIRDVRRPDLPDPAPDVIVGGFPCQPFSHAGKQRGQDDPRHLWPEMFRLIRECRPTWVVGENVVGIVQLGLDEVLSDLESEGYATRTFNIPACAIGAPHIRQRLWVIAHADSESEPDGAFDGNAGQRQLGFGWGDVADPDSDDGRRGRGPESSGRGPRLEHSGGGECSRNVAHATRNRDRRNAGEFSSAHEPEKKKRPEARIREFDPASQGNGSEGRRPEHHWQIEPDVGRLVDGLPDRVPQLRALGNAIVPQIAQEIGRAIKVAHDGDV